MENKLVCTSPSVTILNDQLFGGVTYKQVTNSDTDLRVGDVVAAQITFTTSVSTLTESTVIQYNRKYSTEASFRRIGYYYVDKISYNDGQYTVTAYDLIAKLDTPCDEWLATQTTSTTIYNLYKAVIAHYGLTNYNTIALPANSNMPVTPSNLVSSGITGRQVMQYIAQAAGCFVLAADNNKVMAMYYGEYNSSAVVTASQYKSISMADKPTPAITAVTVESNAGVTTYGSGNYVLNLGYNPIFNGMNSTTIQSYLTPIYNRVHGYGAYYPCTFSTYLDYNVNAGDIITINSKRVIIFNKTMDENGCYFECTGDITRGTSNSITDTSGKLSSSTGQIGLMNATDDTWTFRGQNSTAGVKMSIKNADTIPQFNYLLSGAPMQNVYIQVTTQNGMSSGKIGSGFVMDRDSTGNEESINGWLNELDVNVEAAIDAAASAEKATLIYDDIHGMRISGTLTDGTYDANGLKNTDNSASTHTISTWNITGSDFSLFKYLKIYWIRNDGELNSACGCFDLPLEKVIEPSSGTNYLSSDIKPMWRDRNRLQCVQCAVDEYKEKFSFFQAYSLYGTAATTTSAVRIHKIVGYRYS